jgi:drug/metabolite transporter (DMT)-like permease
MTHRASPTPGPGASLRVPLALMAVYVLWGSTFLAMRVAIESFPPLLMCGPRYALAGAAMYGVLRLRGVAAPTPEQWRASLLAAVLVLANGAVAIAEQTVASSVCAILFASIPLWAALFSGLWGQRPRGREWLGVLLGSVGVVLLHLEGDLRAIPRGAALVMLGTASMALGSVWTRHLSLPFGPMATAAQLVFGGAVFLRLSVLHRDRLAAVPSPRSVGALLYLAVFGSLVAYTAYTFLQRTVRPALATSDAYVNPVVAVLLGAGLAGERVGLAGLASMGVILAGLALLTLARAPAAPRATRPSEA